MLTISTIPEALAELDKQTGRTWTESELFDVATTHGIELHAAVPSTARVRVRAFAGDGELIEDTEVQAGEFFLLAQLISSQVPPLLIRGESLVSAVESCAPFHMTLADVYNPGRNVSETCNFTEPLRITRDDVRIKSESLEKILALLGTEHTESSAAVKVEAVPNKSPNGDDWKVQARVIADECFDRDTANNCRDSLSGYSKRVMELMQKREIKGPRGIIDNANTVMREALQGGKWWANKSK